MAAEDEETFISRRNRGASRRVAERSMHEHCEPMFPNEMSTLTTRLALVRQATYMQ